MLYCSRDILYVAESCGRRRQKTYTSYQVFSGTNSALVQRQLARGQARSAPDVMRTVLKIRALEQLRPLLVGELFSYVKS